MEVKPREIKTYETLDSKCPFEDWLDGLKDRNGRVIIKQRIQKVALGNLGDHKSVGDGVFELRIDYGPGYRVYFGQLDKIIILLLCGGDKSTQGKDIVKAQEYWQEYKRRNL